MSKIIKLLWQLLFVRYTWSQCLLSESIKHRQTLRRFFFFLVYRGGFGLWLDADLYHGSSFSCPTFRNASLSTQEDFIVQDLEVWTVQN